LGGSPFYAIDGNISTRWSTGAQQTPGQWFEVDMNGTNAFYELSLDAGSSSSDYPRGYQVNVSKDGANWGSPVATGAGTSALTLITFPNQVARFIRVTQTGSVSGLWWSVHEFNVVGQPVSFSPTQLSFTTGPSRLQLTWPSDHLGWTLQAQTNSPNSGLGTNWVAMPASTMTNAITLPINSTNGSVFFRLAQP
jgi:hypothetical protein